MATQAEIDFLKWHASLTPQQQADFANATAPGAADTTAGDGNLIDPATGGLVDVTSPDSPYYGGVQPGVTRAPDGTLLTSGPYAPLPSTEEGPTPEEQARLDLIEANRRSARGTIGLALREIDMEDMTEWAYDLVLQDLSPEEILLKLRGTDRYKVRFEGNELRRQAGKNLWTEKEILTYEDTLRSTLREWGIPLSLYDTTSEIAQFIGKDLSVPEVNRRIEKGFAKVTASPDLRSQFRDWYGPDGDVALAMYFFDTDRALPLLEQQAGAATLGGIGIRYGVTMSKQRAESFVQQGVNIDLAPDAFGRLGQLDPLFHETVSENQDFTSEEQGLDYVFGTNGNMAESVLKRRLEDRNAAFAGAGQARIGQDSSAFASTK